MDWTKIQSAYDFEDLVTTLIFFNDLLSVHQVKQIARNDLFWTTGRSEDKAEYVYRVIFDNPRLEADQRKTSRQRRFDEKVATAWRHGKPDTHVFLYINFDDPPPGWAENHDHLKIITATDITDTIEAEQWWPIFHKYFEGGMRIKDAEECEFLEVFMESLVQVADELTVKEAINVISWVASVAFYRPKEALAFSLALYKSEKSPQDEKHPVFGTTTLGKGAYLRELPDLLKPIAAHLEHFEEALELLLRVSSEIDKGSQPIRGFLSEAVENMTGYYFGRDFLIKYGRAHYMPDFNLRTLDVIERMLKEEDNNALLFRCLAVLPNLLKMKVDTSEWSGDKGSVTWREYRLPLADEGLRRVRMGALGLLFTAFNESGDENFRHRCLVELRDAFRHLSTAEELHGEFLELLGFLGEHADDEDPFVLNWILEILESFPREGLGPISSEVTTLQKRLNANFELDLYHLLFGKKGWDPPREAVQRAIQQTLDQWGDNPKAFLLLVDGFHKSADSYPTGLRSFLRILGRDQTEFAAGMISVISDEQAFRANLEPLFVQSLGYLLSGIKLKDEARWHICVNALLAEPDDNTVTIVLTGLHLHDYNNFTVADLELVETLISGANEKTRILGAETLWYLHKFDDFTAVLKVFESLSENMSQDLAASVLKGISRGSYQEGFADKWVAEDRRGILKRIILSLSGFPRLDWDSHSGYELEVLLRVLWKYSTDDLLEFFQLRIDPDRVNSEGYDPLPYDLNTLFQGVSDEKQNEFVSRVLNWDTERYGIYWIARLIGLVCSKNVLPSTILTLQSYISTANKNRFLLIISILEQIPLGVTFYDLAMLIVKKAYGQKDVRSQLYSAFISKTGGSRSIGEPYPSHVRHKKLIYEFRFLNMSSEEVQEFLDQWEKEIDAMIQRDQHEDLER